MLGAAVLAAIPAHAQDPGCTFRNAASPTPSVTYVLCQQGNVLATKNGGGAWTSLQTGAKTELETIGFLDAARGFVAGTGGVLLATEDGGMHWQTRKSGVADQLRAIAVAGLSAWVSGYKGVILHSTDGGRTWAPQTTGVLQALEDIYFVDPQHGWAVGWAGTILRTTDGGAKWEQIRVPAATWSLSSVFFRDANDGWIAGFAGQILRSRDGGLTWESQKSPSQSPLSSVLFDKSGRGWIATDQGFLTTTDSGESWHDEPVTNRIFPIRLLFVNNSVWALGQFGVLKRSTSAEKWEPVSNLVATGSADQILVTNVAPVQSDLQKGEDPDQTPDPGEPAPSQSRP